MKIVVLGGTGLIGSRLVIALAEEGHAVIAASPKSGVNTFTAEGLTAAVEGAEVVVDVTNSPFLDDDSVVAFFEASASNIAKAEVGAGVRHHVALSIVGVDRLSEGGYFRGKIAQEKIIEASRSRSRSSVRHSSSSSSEPSRNGRPNGTSFICPLSSSNPWPRTKWWASSPGPR
jgi:uncharacterized protein YbjT (DUF2867 family)